MSRFSRREFVYMMAVLGSVPVFANSHTRMVETSKKLEDYYKNHAPRLRQEGLELFADKMLAFRTELEVMEEFYGETN